MRKLILAFLVSSAAAAQQDFSRVQVTVQKVAGNVYFLKGNGGNIAFTAGDDGIAMIDSEFEPLAPKIKAAIAGVSKAPVKFLINTHWHFDHVGGNIAFADTATIMAQANTRERMTRGGKNAFGMTQEPSPAKALPVVTFEQGLSLWWNGEEIKAIHPGLGHTDGDAVIFFTKSNVVHMGDDYMTAGPFPFVDLMSGGSVVGLIHSLDVIIPQIPKDAKIIPGHGEVATLDDLRKFRSRLDEMVSVVKKGLASGKSVQQLQQAKVLAPWDENTKGKFVSADDFIATIAQDLQTHMAKH